MHVYIYNFSEIVPTNNPLYKLQFKIEPFHLPGGGGGTPCM